MKFAFVMDPLESVKAYKDTTYFIMLAAQARGHEVYYLGQEDLFVRDARVFGHTARVVVHADVEAPFTVLERGATDLATMDVVLIRTDPPFDRRYFYATLLLDLLPAPTRVVNRPASLRDWNEKMAALHFPTLSPRSLVTRRADDIAAFVASAGRAVLKPLDGHGGEGIEFLDAGQTDAAQVIAAVTHGGSHWIKVQEYLPAAADGDKRILLLNGEPLGAILRVHAEGKELNNLDAGGTAHPAALSERDWEICRAIKPGLLERGVVFCGIDVIGGMLIEINVTSPTGLQELCRFSGIDHHHRIVAALENEALAAHGEVAGRC